MDSWPGIQYQAWIALCEAGNKFKWEVAGYSHKSHATITQMDTG